MQLKQHGAKGESNFPPHFPLLNSLGVGDNEEEVNETKQN